MNDIHSTWEGDNNVLLMQTQNFILKCLKRSASGDIDLPETVEYLAHGQDELEPYSGDLTDIAALNIWFEKRACNSAYAVAGKLMADPENAAKNFEKMQAFDLTELCLTYNQTYCINTFIHFLNEFTHEGTKAVFSKLLLLYIHTRMNNIGVYPRGSTQDNAIKTSIVDLCADLRKDIISLTDVLPFPNKALGPFGNEDLDYSSRYFEHFMSEEGVTERASWWKDVYANANN